jgi:hypothetical protein
VSFQKLNKLEKSAAKTTVKRNLDDTVGNIDLSESFEIKERARCERLS